MMDELLARAITRTEDRPTAVSLTDTSQDDAPLVYVNAAFEKMTGYGRQEVLGRNCRFLQGPGTDPDAVARIRKAVHDQSETAVCLLNYKKDGTPFHNLLMIAPIERAFHGRYFIGCQYQIDRHMRPTDIDMQVANVQGVIRDISHEEETRLTPVIWRSLIARSSAIRLVVDAYLLSVPLLHPDRPREG
ncbi:MAG: PAS domain-containing protein [Pseudomonadota bacterium]